MTAPDYFPFIFASIVLFNIFGQFGNINIIILYARKPNLRTHYGCLLVILSACQSICLFYEFVNVYFAVRSSLFNTVTHRDTCLYVIFPYVFFNSFQNDVIAAIAVDFLLCLSFPIKYRLFNRKYYLPTLLAFPLFHALYLVISAFRTLDDAPIRLCNPPSSMGPEVAKMNYVIYLISASVTLVSYCSGFTLLFLKSRSRTRVNVERRALRSISVLVLIYLLNRFFVMLLINLLNFFGASKETIIVTQDLIVVFAMVILSQNFYVCYFRSHEYRNLLNSQLVVLIRLIRPDYATSQNTLGVTEMNQFRQSQCSLPVNSNISKVVPYV